MKFLVSIMITMLVASFALWGVGDIFQSGGRGTAAKVGGQKISAEEYDRALSVEKERLGSQLGQIPSDEILEYYRLPQATIATLINTMLLRQKTDRLGLRISDATVREVVRKNDMFFNEQGHFDRNRFDTFLRGYGFTEARYVEEVRSDIARALLLAALSAPSPVLPEQVALLHSARDERRTASVLRLSPARVKNVPEPSEGQLQNFYEQEKAQFASKETRNITYLTLSLDDIEDEMDFSDAVLEREYKFREDEFAPKEKRTLVQLLVQDEAVAKAVQSAGGDLKQASEKAGVADKVVELGEYTREEFSGLGIMPQSVVTEVFGLVKGGLSAPFKTALGWHVLQVRAIDKGAAIPFAQAKERLKKILLQEQGGDLIYDISTQLEDHLAAGATLEEAAEKLELKLHTVKALSADGMANGKPANVPDFGFFVSATFALPEGGVSELVANETNTHYFVVRSDSVTASVTPPLEEIRDAVLDAWKQQERARLLKLLAEGVAQRLEKGETTLEKEAASLGISLTQTHALNREMKGEPELPQPVIDELFALQKGASGKAWAHGGDMLIVRADNIIAPPEAERKMAEAALAGELQGSFAQDIREQLVLYLRLTTPVKQYVAQ